MREAITFIQYVCARRDWNMYASELPEPNREQYRTAAGEVSRIISMFGDERFANQLITNEKLLNDYADTLAAIEIFKERLKS